MADANSKKSKTFGIHAEYCTRIAIIKIRYKTFVRRIFAIWNKGKI